MYMRVLKLDLHQVTDYLVYLIEWHTFENSMHQSYSIENKEEIKTAICQAFSEMLEKYDRVELVIKDK